MVVWHCQLGAAGNDFLIPVSFPPCHRVYVPAGFHHLARARGQFNIQHGKQWLGQGHAVPVPAPPALGGVADGASLGSEPVLQTGPIPVEPGPAGSRTGRGSVTQGGCARERLVLVCKSTGLFFPGSVCRWQRGEASRHCTRHWLSGKEERWNNRARVVSLHINTGCEIASLPDTPSAVLRECGVPATPPSSGAGSAAPVVQERRVPITQNGTVHPCTGPYQKWGMTVQGQSCRESRGILRFLHVILGEGCAESRDTLSRAHVTVSGKRQHSIPTELYVKLGWVNSLENA